MAKWRPEHEEKTETKLVPLCIIETDPAVCVRLEEPDRLIVRSLVAAFRAKRFPPPIVVYVVDDNRHVLVDGRARIAAARGAGLSEIMAEIHAGSLVNAAWAAAGINRYPAQARTPAEERLAIQHAIRSAPTSLHDTIAEHVGCTAAAIREARATLPRSGG